MHKGLNTESGLLKPRLILAVLGAGILVGVLALVIPYQIVFLSIALILLALLLITKVHRAYLLFILLVPVTNIRFSVYSPDDTLFNVAFLFHVIVFMVLVSFFLNRVINKLKYSPQYDAFSIIVFFFAFWAFITVFWAPDYKYSSFKCFQLLLCVVAYLLMVRLLVSRKDLRSAVNSWIFMGMLASLALLSSLLLKDEHMFIKEIEKDLFYAFVYVGGFNPVRGSGFADPKSITNFINLATLFAVGSLTLVRERKHRIKFALIIGFMIFSHLFAQVRGALGGLLVGIAFLLIVLRQLRKNLIKSITILGFSLLIIALLFLSFQVKVRSFHGIGTKGGGSRIASLEQGNQSMEVRFNIWKNVLRVLKTHNAFVFGIGTGGSAYYSEPLPHVHSFFLSIAYDLGLVGLGIFSIMVIILTGRLIQVLRSNDSYYRTMLCSFYAGLIAFGVNGLIEFEYFMPLIWVYLGLGIAIFGLSRKEEEVSEEGETITIQASNG